MSSNPWAVAGDKPGFGAWPRPRKLPQMLAFAFAKVSKGENLGRGDSNPGDLHLEFHGPFCGEYWKHGIQGGNFPPCNSRSPLRFGESIDPSRC